MQLEAAQKLAEALIIKHLGHRTEKWTFGFNDRTGAFGICFLTEYRIELSRIFTLMRSNEEVKQTILHEIAHALAPPGSGHGNFWKCIALSIGVKNPKAKTRMTSIDIRIPKWVMVYEGEIIKKYFRKPAKKMFDTLPKRYILGRIESKGKLKLMPYAEFKNTS